ncbi:MAG: glycosyltransferase, partial [Bacteroidales bacterium]|nr:glycosyltransferase [Bacteroidales bacterium]
MMNYIKFIFSLVKDTWSRQAIWYQLKETYKLQGLSGIIDKSYHVLFHSRSAAELALNKKILYDKYTALKPNMLKLKNNIKGFKYLAKISIVMPTYNSNTEWLSVAIESVRAQIYPHWELCIADDASTNNECKDLLRKYQKEDNRIRVVFRNQNGHISNASNSALETVNGDFVALLDHDDKLPEDALYWIAKTINEKPNSSLIYSDEDKFDKQGIRSDPYFKCDWNYSLFLSQNMISHLGVYKTSILKKIGGFRQGYEGSQDYDLALRF